MIWKALSMPNNDMIDPYSENQLEFSSHVAPHNLGTRGTGKLLNVVLFYQFVKYNPCYIYDKTSITLSISPTIWS